MGEATLEYIETEEEIAEIKSVIIEISEDPSKCTLVASPSGKLIRASHMGINIAPGELSTVTMSVLIENKYTEHLIQCITRPILKIVAAK